MTIRTLEERVPEEFTPARLFLDDTEQIVLILQEFNESRKMDSGSTVEDLKIKVKFSTGGQECDDVLDLPKIVKTNRDLSINVSMGGFVKIVLNYRFWFGITWYSLGLTKGDTWSVFHKLQSVFQKRKRLWSTFLHSLPWWLSWPLWIVSLWLIPFLRYPLHKLVPEGAADAIVLLSYGIFITAVVIGVRPTILTLRHSWDPSPFRRYITDKMIPIIVVFLLGIVATLLEEYVRHKYWP
jgi:hypothetical protein